MATCWLNSCLQLMLTAMDYCVSTSSLTSELGNELLRLHSSQPGISLDPSIIKNIIVTAEDTRIATRLSELATEAIDQSQLRNRISAIEEMRLNLISGQQCVRDFFLCINENVLCWPDVYSCFGFKITHSTKCCSCNNVNQSETTQIYVEIPIPPYNSSLNDYFEEYFNTSSLEGLNCDNDCQSFVQVEKRSQLSSCGDTNFFIVILTRAIQTLNGFKLVKNKTLPTNDVFIR